MKTLILYSFFLLMTCSVFGQKLIVGQTTDSIFEKFSKKVLSLKRTNTGLGIPFQPKNIMEWEYADTGSLRKFELKYIRLFGSPPTVEELKMDLTGSSGIFEMARYGTDYVIISMFKNTGIRNHISYYYQVIENE